MKTEPRCSKCSKPTWEHIYRPSVNEDAWECGFCGAKLGWRPDFDKELIYSKVSGLLMDLADADFVSVSNGTMGEVIAWNAVTVCRETERYDQYTIIAAILNDPNLKGHAEYWAKRAENPDACTHGHMVYEHGIGTCQDCGQVAMGVSVAAHADQAEAS